MCRHDAAALLDSVSDFGHLAILSGGGGGFLKRKIKNLSNDQRPIPRISPSRVCASARLGFLAGAILARPDRRYLPALKRWQPRFDEGSTIGHGGAGNSFCWADPDSGVSFAYLTNCRIPHPWHAERLDLVSNFLHSAIL